MKFAINLFLGAGILSHFNVLGCEEIYGQTFKGPCEAVKVRPLFSCTTAELFDFLDVDSEAEVLEVLQSFCDKGESASVESFVPWSAVTKRGYQFDKEFFNGGTVFNEEHATPDYPTLHDDQIERIRDIEKDVLHRRGIAWPDYIYNFDSSQSCEAKAAMCCWTADRSDVGEGSCKGLNCQDEEPVDNTDICIHDMSMSQLASHVQRGVAFYPEDSEDAVNCHGFAWGSNRGDIDDKYKGNLLFHTAMLTGLADNGYVRNVPGAPMCGCLEQMPVVSRADCTEMEVEETWTIEESMDGPDLLTMKLTDAAVSFDECDGNDLASYIEAEFPDRQVDDYLAGSCRGPEQEFLNMYGYRKASK